MLRDEVQLALTGVNLTRPAFSQVTADLRDMGQQIRGLNTLMGSQKSVTDAVTRSYKQWGVDGTASIRALKDEVVLLTKDIQFQIDEIARLGVAYKGLGLGGARTGGGGGGGGGRAATPGPTGNFTGSLPLAQQAAYIAAQERQNQIDTLVAQNMTKSTARSVVSGGSFIVPPALPRSARNLTTTQLQALAADQAKQDRLSQLVQAGIPVAQARRVASGEDQVIAAQKRATDAAAAAKAAAGTTTAKAASQTAAREAAAADAEARKFALARNQIIAGLGEKVGVPARLGFSAGLLGPVAIGGLAAGVVGYQLSKQSLDYQSAVRQTIAQSDPTKDMRVADQHAQQLGKTILDYTQQGTSFYTPTTIASSLVTLLSHGYSPQAVKAILPGLNTLSKQNNATDLTGANQILNIEAQMFAQGPKSSGKELTGLIDYTSSLEKMSSATPGAITAALPTLFTGLINTGISKEEIGGLFLKTLTSNTSAQKNATGWRSLLQDITTKNTAGANKEAGRIGLAMGPGAVQAYGGIYNYLQEINRTTLAASGGDVQQQRKELSLILPQAAKAGAFGTFQQLFQGGGIGQAMGYTSALGKAAGTADITQAELSKGVNQQATQLMTHLNTDMIKMGDTLNEKVVPALLNFANNGLKKAEDFVSGMGDLGSALDKYATKINLPGHIPGDLTNDFKFLLTGGPVGLVASAASQAAQSFLKSHPDLGAGGPSGGSANPHAGMHMITVGAGRQVWVPDPNTPASPPPSTSGVRKTGRYVQVGTSDYPGGAGSAYIDTTTMTQYPTLAAAQAAVPQVSNPVDYQNDVTRRSFVGLRQLNGRYANLKAPAGYGLQAPGGIYDVSDPGRGWEDRNFNKVRAMINSENTPAKLSASAQNQATRDARTQLNTDISKSLGRDVYNKDLINIAGALATSVYSPAQQQGILTTESRKVGKLNLGDDQANLKTGLAQYKLGNLSTQDLRTLLKNELSDIPGAGLSKAKQQALGYSAGQQVDKAIYIQTQLDAANMQLHAAQINQESARIHHESFAVQQKDARATYAAAQLAINAKVVHGDLKGVDIKAAYDAAKDTLDTQLAAIQQQMITPFQDRITNAQLKNDPAAFKKAIQAEIGFYKTPDSLHRLFGDSTVAQGNAILQAQQQIANFTRTPGPQLIRPNTQGLGFGLAGPGSTIAELSGGPQGRSEELALLRSQIQKDDQTIGELRQMVAYLRTISQTNIATEKHVRPKPAPAPPGRKGHGGGRIAA